MFQDLDPRFRPWAEWLYRECQKAGLRPRVTSTYRSRSHQARLYDEYRRGLRPYPAARPGCSQHNYGLAIDMVVERADEVGRVWESHGGYWGGARDPVHFGVSWFPCS